MNLKLRNGESLATVALAALLALVGSGCVREDEILLTPEQEKTIAEHILKEEPHPAHRVGANLEDRIEFIGWEVSPEHPVPGEPFTLTWYWRCLAEMDQDWMIFVHLDSYMGGRYRLNLDHHAIQGLYNTRRWKKGQIIKDVQKARFPADFPEGDVTVFVGAFLGDTRLRVRPGVKTDGNDRVDAGILTLAPRSAAASGLPRIEVRRATSPITVDGKLDEAAWAAAATTGKFKNTDGRGEPALSTTARLLWDDTNLYLGVEVEDPDVWSTFTERDSNLWEQEVIEVFLDPEGDGRTYAEIQVSPANVLFDAFFPTYRSDLAQARTFDSKARSAVAVNGTLNKRDDRDTGWTLELAIPFASLPPGRVPRPGESWRVNLFRFDAPAGEKQVASAWSPPRVGDFHALHRFGHVVFTDQAQATLPVPAIPLPPTGGGGGKGVGKEGSAAAAPALGPAALPPSRVPIKALKMAPAAGTTPLKTLRALPKPRTSEAPPGGPASGN